MNRLLPLLALLALLATLGAKAPQKTIALDATADAYIVTNAAAPEDPEGLRDKNFGAQDFLKVWYAWKVQKDEQVIAVSLVKFDLAPLKDREVISAHLQLFATRTDLAQPVRLLDVQLVEGPWDEKEVTFNKRPPWGANAAATAAVYGAGLWYSWDVTSSVVQKAKEGTVSYALGLRTLEEKKEEQVVFSSRETGRNGPRLIVTYSAPPSSIPWYIWLIGIAVAAALAFVVGWWLARRQRGAAGSPETM